MTQDTSYTKKPIYDPRRVIEHLQTLQGVMPVRLFAILFPLWDVETTAIQTEGRPYELLEKYIERGIYEGQLHTVEELVNFFQVQAQMVKKILNFLESIGHVTHSNTHWDITSLGYKSIVDGKKYVASEKRVRFYFDAFSSMPLRKEHYHHKTVHVLAPDEAVAVTHLKTWGYRFHLIFSTHAWRQRALQELAARTDKTDSYNVPPEMQELQPLNVGAAYLPMYIIETKTTSVSLSSNGKTVRKPYYLVYTGIQDLHDTYLEYIINDNQTVYAALQSEKTWEADNLWYTWLHEKGITGVLPLERADGTWQASLPTSAFEEPQSVFKVSRIGDYELRDGYFIQIWCNDIALRRKSALDRILRMAKKYSHLKPSAIQEQLRIQAKQLQTGQLDIHDLQQRAAETGMKDSLKMIYQE